MPLKKNHAKSNSFSKVTRILNGKSNRLRKIDIVPDSSKFSCGMSKEYRLALEKINCSKQVIGGHYQVALPRRPGALSLTKNGL